MKSALASAISLCLAQIPQATPTNEVTGLTLVHCNTGADQEMSPCYNTEPETVWPGKEDTAPGFVAKSRDILLSWNSHYTFKWNPVNLPTTVMWKSFELDDPIWSKGRGAQPSPVQVQPADAHDNPELPSGQNSFDFTFQDLAKFVAARGLGTNSTNNFTAVEIEAYASRGNNIVTFRPQGSELETTLSRIMILNFKSYHYVYSGFLTQYSNGKDSEKKKWKLGVGIGVGLGLPLFMLLAFELGRRGESRRINKGIDFNGNNE